VTCYTSFHACEGHDLLLNEVFCRLFFQSFASEASGTGAAAAGGWMFALEVDEGTVG